MNCSKCNILLQDYFDMTGGFTEYVCWRCGHYESNSPAYLLNPDGFKNMIRDNPLVLRRIVNRSTYSLHQKKQPQNGQNHHKL